MRKAQSSMEYLVTYGFALIIIAVAAGLLYYFLFVPRTSAPNLCNFTQEVYCDDVSVALAGTSGYGALYFEVTNQNTAALSNGIFTATINGKNYTGGTCVGPLESAVSTLTPPGSAMYCGVVIPSGADLYEGQFVSGSIYLTVENCGLSANYLQTNACSNTVNQIFVGSFSGHAETESELFLGPTACDQNPTSFSNTNVPVCYTANTVLTGSIIAYSITVYPGVTLTTDGDSLLAWGYIDNEGEIYTGNVANGALNSGTQVGGNGGDGLYMQAGYLAPGVIYAAGWTGLQAGTSGGGGGGGGGLLLAYSTYYEPGTYYNVGGTGYTGTRHKTGDNDCGGSGGGTVATGGTGGCGQSVATCPASGYNGGSGTTPSGPTLTNQLIDTWYANGMSFYLDGGGGGASGTISGTGTSGGSFADSYGGSGGGGGWLFCSTSGGSGGTGSVLLYRWTSEPVPIPMPSPPVLIRQWLP